MRVTIYVRHPITTTIIRRDRGASEQPGPLWAVRIFRDPDSPSWEGRWLANAVLLEQPIPVRTEEDQAVANVLEIESGTILALVWPEASNDSHQFASLWYYVDTLLGGWTAPETMWINARPSDRDLGYGREFGGWKFPFEGSWASESWLYMNLSSRVAYDRQELLGIEVGRLITMAIGEANRAARDEAETNPFAGGVYDVDYTFNAEDAVWTLNNEPADIEPPPPDQDIAEPTKSDSWLPFLLAAGAVMALTKKKR